MATIVAGASEKKPEVLESTFNDCPIFKLFEVGFDGGMLSFILKWLGNDCLSNWVINDLPSTLRCQELMPRPIQEPRPDNEHRMAVVGSSSYKPNMWSAVLNASSDYVRLVKELYVQNCSLEAVRKSFGQTLDMSNVEKKKVHFDIEIRGVWKGCGDVEQEWEYDMTFYLTKVESRKHSVLGQPPPHKSWSHGYVVHTLRKSPLPQFQSRIGEKAIEMVCGFIHHTSIDDERAPITLGSGLGSCCYTHFEMMGYAVFPVDSQLIGPDWYRFKIRSKPILDNIKQANELYTKCNDYSFFLGRSAGNDGKFDGMFRYEIVKIPKYLHFVVLDANALLKQISTSSNIDQLRNELVYLKEKLESCNGEVYISVKEITAVLKKKKSELVGWGQVKEHPKGELPCNTATLVGQLLQVVRSFIADQRKASSNRLVLPEKELCAKCKVELLYCNPKYCFTQFIKK